MVTATTNHRPPAGTAVSNAPHTTPSSTAPIHVWPSLIASPTNRPRSPPAPPARSPPTCSNRASSSATRSPRSKSSSAKGPSCPWASTSSAPIDGIPTGSLSLDIALGGQGIPCGRVVEIFGPESSGKTTLALHVDRQAQTRRRHRRLHRRRTRPGPHLGQEARRRARNAAGQPARQRRRGHAHHRDAHQDRTPST